MNANAVSVAVVDGKTITKTVELGGAGRGQPVRIQAVKGGAYLLAEGEQRVAPENVTVKRVGKDLHLCLERGELAEPQLIIEGFYGSDGQLVGAGEDGSFHEYVASDATDSDGMADGNSAALALGATPLSGFDTRGEGGGFWTPTMLGLGALGVAGAIAAIAGGGGGGGGGSAPTPDPVPEPEAPQEEEPEEQTPAPEGEEGSEEPPVVEDTEQASDEGTDSILTFSGSELMFDYAAVAFHDPASGNTDEVWAAALSLGDVFSPGSGELFVEDASPEATLQWVYATDEVDLQALISDEDVENWSAQAGMSDVGVASEIAPPSTPLDDSLFHVQD